MAPIDREGWISGNSPANTFGMSPLDDRSYFYLAKTFDAPQLELTDFVSVMGNRALPTWRALHAAGLIASAQVLHKVGDIDLFTSAVPVRDWRYFALLQITDGVGIDQIVEAEWDAGISDGALAKEAVHYLSNEVLERRAGSGTAIPLPSPHCSTRPANHVAGIEYIQIPDDYWKEYQRFMHDVMGPVGARLVAHGDSYQIQIMERTRVLHHSASLPDWNRIHILWGDFDDTQNGFVERASRIAHDVFDPGFDVHGALSSTNHYRIKPKMSKNQLLAPLCVGMDQR